MASFEITDLNHFAEFGEIYEALDAVQEIETMLARLKRRHLMSDEDVLECARHLGTIEQVVGHYLLDGAA